MEQLAGGVTAAQLRPMELEEDVVAVSPVGADGTALQLVDEPSTSTPLIMGWSLAPFVNAITMAPLLLAVAVNCSTTAVYFAWAVP